MPNTTVISLIGCKGGVGKTTLAGNISGLLADLGFRVLAIDADIQQALSQFYPPKQPIQSGFADVLARGGMILQQDIVPTEIDGLDMIVSNVSTETQSWLDQRQDSLAMLKRAVRQPIVRETYDFVVVDSQGARGAIQSTVAMAADLIVSPCPPRAMDYEVFIRDTLAMLDEVNSMSDFAPALHTGPLSIVINGENRTNHAKAISNQVREQFRTTPDIRVLDTALPWVTAYSDCRMLHQPVHRINQAASVLMHEVIYELLPNLKGMQVEDKSAAASMRSES